MFFVFILSIHLSYSYLTKNIINTTDFLIQSDADCSYSDHSAIMKGAVNTFIIWLGKNFSFGVKNIQINFFASEVSLENKKIHVMQAYVSYERDSRFEWHFP